MLSCITSLNLVKFMASTMKRTTFHHFHYLNTKTQPQEVVEIRDEPPRLKLLFPWEFTKILTENDVAHFGSLELHPNQAYNHIFKYWDENMVSRVMMNGEQVPIVVWDLDTGTKHNLTLKKWPYAENFLIHAGWTRDFVARRGLKVGMMIGMYWDVRSESLRFSLINMEEEENFV